MRNCNYLIILQLQHFYRQHFGPICETDPSEPAVKTSENSSFCNAHNALSLSAARALIKVREEILDL
jgi:hypothetical protein